MIPAGEGLLKKKFLELKAKLEKEGLFDPERKRPIPFFPKAIGIVTSGTGAVIHDMLVKLNERMPQVQKYIVDVRVQGTGAAEEISEGVKRFNQSNLVDIIIVARGGGSLEDLWAFNEELLVRTIFASKIPVISGVGHEVDITLSDLVADLRAPTPTAAAEMVVPKRSELIQRIDELEQRLMQVERWFEPLLQGLDDLTLRLSNKVSNVVQESSLKLKAAEASLKMIRPDNVLEMFRTRVERLSEKLSDSGRENLTKFLELITRIDERLKRAFSIEKILRLKDKLGSFEKQLFNLHPRHVLERGFSLVEYNGNIVRSANDLKPDDTITVNFATDALHAKVQNVNKDNLGILKKKEK